MKNIRIDAGMVKIIIGIFGIFGTLCFCKNATEKEEDMKKEMIVYVGTYTSTASKGIYTCKMDAETGQLKLQNVTQNVENPSYLDIDPQHKYLYAVNEIGSYAGESQGAVSAFAIHQDDWSLEFLNQQPSRGANPCYIAVDQEGKNVLVANYTGGNVAVLSIQQDGKLAAPSDVKQHSGSGPNKQRQSGPHAHSINLDPAGQFAFAADLGIDKIMIYRYSSAGGALTLNDPAFVSTNPGAGPRHFAFHSNGKNAYVINELNSTITVFDYNADIGRLVAKQTITTLPQDFSGNNSCADIHVHPSGKFVYGSNRGHDSIVMFSVDEATGKLVLIGHESTGGRTPRNFAIDNSGAFLLAANQDSDNIVVFRIDNKTGRLSSTGQQVSVPKPVCIKIIPAGASE